MFDFIQERNDNGTPRYTLLYVQIWLDSLRVQVKARFPHLTYGNMFGAGSESDYQSCAEANDLMVKCCIDIWLEVTPSNCEDYDTVHEMLTQQMETHQIARQYFRDRTPNHATHP